MSSSSASDPRTIHEAFGLSYASYLVIPRLVLQSMPEDWQVRFVAMIDECHERFDFDTLMYTVSARTKDGQYVTDPLRDYRHGHIEEVFRVR